MTQKERNKQRNLEFKTSRIQLSCKLMSENKNVESCEMCGNPSNEDHHIIKKAEDNYKFNSDVNNLIRVCRSCHILFHSYKSKELFNINRDRFLKCMEWLESQRKYSSLSCFERNFSWKI